MRRGTAGIIRNSVLSELSGWALDVDGLPTVGHVTDGTLKVESNVFFHNGPPPGYDGWPDNFDVPSGMTMQNDCPPP
jgi:hypothetical protein